MKNFNSPGDYGLSVIAPVGGVVSGQVVVIGDIVGIAATDAAAGAPVAIAPEGVYTLAKVPGDALALGATAKVDGTGTVGLAGTTAIGWVVQAAASGTTTALVRLCPGISGTAALAAAETKHEPQPKHEHEREPVGAGAKRH